MHRQSVATTFPTGQAPGAETVRQARPFALAALVGAAAYLVLAVVQILNPTFDDQLDGFVDYLNDGAFTVALITTAIALRGVQLVFGAPRRAVVIIAIGQLLVAAGVAAGLVTGESPNWFAAVGLPGNLLAFIGFVLLARWGWHTRHVPRWVAILMAISVPVGLGTGEFGGSVVPATMWAYLGLRMLTPDTSNPTPGQGRALSSS